MQPTLHVVEDLDVALQGFLGQGVELIQRGIGCGDAGPVFRTVSATVSGLDRGRLHRWHGSRPRPMVR
jgi:hypothetical protein